jgi:hypothetical protein
LQTPRAGEKALPPKPKAGVKAKPASPSPKGATSKSGKQAAKSGAKLKRQNAVSNIAGDAPAPAASVGAKNCVNPAIARAGQTPCVETEEPSLVRGIQLEASGLPRGFALSASTDWIAPGTNYGTSALAKGFYKVTLNEGVEIVYDIEIEAGPDVQAAFFGYEEFLGANLTVAIVRCKMKLGADCAIEWHKLTGDAKFARNWTKLNDIAYGGVNSLSTVFEDGFGALWGDRLTAKLALKRGKFGQQVKKLLAAEKDATPGEGDDVTLMQAVRLPAGAQGLAYEPQGYGDGKLRVITDVRRFAITFVSCHKEHFAAVAQQGLQCTDSMILMAPPVLQNLSPQITKNIVYLKLFGLDLFQPRCLLPIGEACKRDSAGSKKGKGKDSKGASGGRTKSKPSGRKLHGSSFGGTFVAISTHDGNAARDSLVASRVAQREVPVVSRSLSQLDALEQAPELAPRRTLTAVPRGDGSFALTDLSFVDEAPTLAPGAPFGRRLSSRAAATGAPAGGVSPYGAVYGPLWDMDAHGLEPSGGRRLFDIGDLSPFDEEGGCVSGSMKLFEYTRPIREYAKFMMVAGIVPVDFFLGAYMDATADMGGAFCISTRSVALTLIPAVRLRAVVQAGINLAIVKGGVGVEATLATTALVPILTLGLNTGGGFRVALEMRMVLIPFQIRFYGECCVGRGCAGRKSFFGAV